MRGWVGRRAAAAIAFLAMLGGGLVALSVPADATTTCTIRWHNPAGGDWMTAANWAPARVPASTDNVCIGSPTALSVQLTLPSTPTGVAALNLTGPVTLSVVHLQTGDSALDVATTATVGVGSTLGLQSGGLDSGDSLALVMAPMNARGPATGTLMNHGTVLAGGVAGTEGVIIAGAVTNTGTIHATGWTTLFGSVTNRGTVSVDSGQRVDAFNPDILAFVNDLGGTIAASGVFRVLNGTFVEDGGKTTGNPVLVPFIASPQGPTTAATLSFLRPGDAHFQVAGFVSIQGTLASTETLDVNDGGVELSGPFTNDGRITMSTCKSGGALTLDGNTALNAGTLEVAGTSCVLMGLQPATGNNFANTGKVIVDPGSSLLTLGVMFANGKGVISNGGTFQTVGTTFEQSAGRITGNPVAIGSSSTLSLTGTGGSSFTIMGSDLEGNIGPAQHVSVVPNPSGPATTAPTSFSNAGYLTLGGPLVIADGGTLTNHGHLVVPAATSMQGGLADAGLATTQIVVDPVTATGGLTATGSVSLGGSLKITASSHPTPGQAFSIISGSSLAGTFAQMASSGAHFTAGYSAAACTVMAA